MNLIASFPTGVSNITVNGLTQWDYGRKLQIQSPDLPSMVEVHFWCAGMNEAVVRSCSALNGVAEAAIPDQCLEQAGPVVAWVYEIHGTEGATTKTITLPISTRVRPQPGATVPEDVSDRYTEALTAMNAIVDDMENGNVTVNRARTAGRADEAGHADTAGRADSAGIADSALTAALCPLNWQKIYEGDYALNSTWIRTILKPKRSYLFSVCVDSYGDHYTFVLGGSAYTFGPYVSSVAMLLSVDGQTYKGSLYLRYNTNGLCLMCRDLEGQPLNYTLPVTISVAELSGESASVLREVTSEDLAAGGTFKFVCTPDASGQIAVGLWTTNENGDTVQNILSAHISDADEDHVEMVPVNAFAEGETLQTDAGSTYQIYRVV